MDRPRDKDRGKNGTSLSAIRLVLFVTGLTPRSTKAIENIRSFCESELGGTCNLQVVDIYLEPELAAQEQVIAVPLLIRYEPVPERRIIGDLSDTAKLRRSLGLQAA